MCFAVFGVAYCSIDTRCHTFANSVSAVPDCFTTITLKKFDQIAIGIGDTHFGVVHQSFDGNIAMVIGVYGVGVRVKIIEVILRGDSIAHIRNQTRTCADKDLARRLLDGNGEDIIVGQ